MIPANLSVDYNGDDVVDNICFVVSGTYMGWSELLWPHKWSFYGMPTKFINGKKVNTYNFMLLDAGENYFSVGTLCHEMFHTLGAPDLYHYDKYDDVHPVGRWDLMDYNGRAWPQHSTAYLKFRYGKWIKNIPEIKTDGTYTLNALADQSGENNCYRIASADPNIWYILEYRKQDDSYEQYLPGSGLIVYRIDQSLNGNANFDGVNTYDGVYVFRPNATHDTVAGNVNDAHLSSQSGRTQIGQSTNPSIFMPGGIPDPRFSITNVSSAGETISFTVTLDSLFFYADIPSGQTLKFQKHTKVVNVMGELDTYDTIETVTIRRLSTLNGFDSIHIPYEVTYNGVTYPIVGMEPNCFSNVAGLRKLTFECLDTIPSKAFAGCSDLTYVEIPSCVRSIASSAFSNCNPDTLIFMSSATSALTKSVFGNVKDLTVGGNAKSIDSWAFLSCDSLRAVHLAADVNVGSYAFYSCSNLRRVDYWKPYAMGSNEGKGSELGVEYKSSIGNQSFWNCSSLSYLQIPHTVSKIGSNITSSCDTLVFESHDCQSSLNKKVFGNVKVLKVGRNIDTIFASAFSNSSSLESLQYGHISPYYNESDDLSIGKGLYIQNKAFAWCSNLTDVSFSYGGLKTIIGDSAFYSDGKLVFPASVPSLDSIGERAFYYCTGLGEKLTIPSSLEYIGPYAFYGASCIKSVEFPYNNVSTSAMCFPSSVDTVFVKSNTPFAINDTTFASPFPTVLVVPCGSIPVYSADAFWGQFKQIQGYSECYFHLSAQANPEVAGTVSGMGTFEYGDTTTLSASANDGFVFLQWNDSVTDNPRKVVVVSDTSFSAIFAKTLAVHDTVTEIVHDTLTIAQLDTVYLHDTIVETVQEIVHDTLTIAQLDTVYLHDTIVETVQEIVHDTLTIAQLDTVYLHDTIVETVQEIVHDTLTIAQLDTVYLHDTIVEMVQEIVYDTLTIAELDTLYLHDTVTVKEEVYVYDTITTIITETLYDTIYPATYTLSLFVDAETKGIVVGSGKYPQGQEVEVAAIPNLGYVFTNWSDGSQENPRRMVINEDEYLMAYFSEQQGIAMPDFSMVKAYVENGTIVVEGVANRSVRVLDEVGRTLFMSSNANDIEYVSVVASGVYLIQVDGYLAGKVPVVR